MDRAAIDSAIAKLLAAALVRELRAEMVVMDTAVQGERPAAGKSDAGAECASEARTGEDTDKRLARAS
jgi:hypothetical protein